VRCVAVVPLAILTLIAGLFDLRGSYWCHRLLLKHQEGDPGNYYHYRPRKMTLKGRQAIRPGNGVRGDEAPHGLKERPLMPAWRFKSAVWAFLVKLTA
jgi:hypothetical protein